MSWKPLTEQKKDDLYESMYAKAKARHPNYEMGYLVGDLLVHRYVEITLDIEQSTLPTPNESFELKMVHNTASQDYNNRVKWKPYLDKRHALERKYLPGVLKCTIAYLHLEDKQQFIKGIGAALWDSDRSNYSCEDIEVVHQNPHALYITLKLAN